MAEHRDPPAPAGFRAFIGLRKNRRPLVVTGASSFTLLLIMLELGRGLPVWLYFPLLALLALLAALHALVFSLGVDALAPQDEVRQRAYRDAHYHAYRAVFWLLSAFLGYWLVASSLLLWLPRGTGQTLTVFVGIWGLVLALPALIFFWNAPDVEPSP